MISTFRHEFNVAITKIEEDTSAILLMFSSSKLKSNIKKTKVIIFQVLCCIKPMKGSTLSHQFNILLNDQPIDFCIDIKLLGVYLSYNLTWNNYISMITKNINFSLH